MIMNIKISYPDQEAERKILNLSNEKFDTKPKNILSPKELLEIQSFIKEIPVGNYLPSLFIPIFFI